jgi:hypothetical protein
MDLLVTDLTEMHAGHYCVAGWCAARNRMVRPLPNGAHWTLPMLDTNRIRPGATIRVAPNASPASGAYPHRTEDTRVILASLQSLSLGPAAWFGPGAPPTASTLQEAFEGHLACNGHWRDSLTGAHVPQGTRARSLWALDVAVGSLRFIETFNKLTVTLDDGDQRYRLPVSSRALREVWRDGGLAALAQTLPAEGPLHVRVGLARPFGDSPDKCYVMLNGVHW